VKGKPERIRHRSVRPTIKHTIEVQSNEIPAGIPVRERARASQSGAFGYTQSLNLTPLSQPYPISPLTGRDIFMAHPVAPQPLDADLVATQQFITSNGANSNMPRQGSQPSKKNLEQREHKQRAQIIREQRRQSRQQQGRQPSPQRPLSSRAPVMATSPVDLLEAENGALGWESIFVSFINLVLIAAAVGGLVRLLPVQLAQRQRLQLLETQVEALRSRVSRYQATLDRGMDSLQQEALIKERFNFIPRNQAQIRLIAPPVPIAEDAVSDPLVAQDHSLRDSR
jgi:hypothetical protein